MEELSILLSENWNIQESKINKIYKTAWSVGNNYIMKSGTDINSLKRNIAITQKLRSHSIPVAEIINTTSGGDYIVSDNSYYLLTKRIPGKHIKDIYEDKDYIHISQKCGEIIARLHKTFKECEEEIDCWDNDLSKEVDGWVTKILKDEGFPYITKDIVIRSANELRRLSAKLPRQLIHRDIHFGNILFDNNEISGYIDFDLSQRNIRIFDICYFLLGLLLDNTEDNEKIRNGLIL